MTATENPGGLSLSPLGRILCLTSSFPASDDDHAGVFVARLAQDLSDLGWSIDVLAPHGPGLPPLEVRKGVRIFRFRYLWPESLETLGHSGSTVVHLRRSRLGYIKVGPLVTVQGVRTLQRILAYRYDLIHSHWIIPQGFHGMIGSLLRGVPHVVTVHGGDIYSFRGLLITWLKKVILRQAGAITVNSSQTMLQVRDIVPSHQNISHIPMGIEQPCPDQKFVGLIRQQYRKGNGPLLLFVGRVVEEKGVGDLIKALDLLRDDLPDARSIIVGDGQDREHFLQYARQVGVMDKVFFVGHVPPSQVANYYAAADIFVGPSKQGRDGWQEGLGMTFLEAMSAKLPVIATRSGGIVDTVRDGVTGLLVAENAPEEIAVAVKKLVAEPDLVQRMVEQGFNLASETFSRHLCAQKFSRLFVNVLQSRHPAV